MSARSRGSRAVGGLIQSTRRPRLCSDCIHRISSRQLIPRRSYAVAASTLNQVEGPPLHDPTISSLPPITSPSTPTPYTLLTSILLSRPPLLTKPPTPFESAYYLYQKRLNERLVLPFTRYFYFKDKTPSIADWKAEVKSRGGVVARDTGGYNAYAKDGKGGWNDEVLVGDEVSKKVRGEVAGWDRGSGEEEVEGERERLVEGERRMEGDELADRMRLDRQGGRTLYLVVRRGVGGEWMFPTGEVVGRESLYQSAQRILASSAGLNMNTWFVGHAPIGHQIIDPYYVDKQTKDEIQTPGKKTFFMRARILAGQADLKGNDFGWTEFKWLTKSELERFLSPRLFSGVWKMLADR